MHRVPFVQVEADLFHKQEPLGIVLDGYGLPELAVNLSGCGLDHWGAKAVGHWSLTLK